MTSLEARKALLAPLYEAYNRRDVSAMLSALDPQVEWCDLIEGKPIKGRAAVGDYWRGQFELMRTEVSPLTYTRLSDDRVAVEVAQTMRKLDGQLWGNERVLHTFTFSADGLVLRMEPS